MGVGSSIETTGGRIEEITYTLSEDIEVVIKDNFEI